MTRHGNPTSYPFIILFIVDTINDSICLCVPIKIRDTPTPRRIPPITSNGIGPPTYTLDRHTRPALLAVDHVVVIFGGDW